MPLYLDDVKIDKRKWLSEGAYVLAIFMRTDVSTGSGPMLLSQEFVLPIPPTEYEDEEIPGTFIQPMQRRDEEGAFHVETTGLQSKTISIAGTTGVLPRRGVLDYLAPAAAAAQRDALTVFGGGPEDTGYYFFHKLREIIALYQSRVADAPVPSAIEMRFFNLKDQEYYVVAPLSFRRRRMAGRPMQYFYSLQLRVTGKIEIDAPMKARLEGGRFFEALTWASRVGRWMSAVQQIAGNALALVQSASAAVGGLANSLNGLHETLTHIPGAFGERVEDLGSAIGSLGNAAKKWGDAGAGVLPTLGTSATASAYAGREQIRQQAASGVLSGVKAKLGEFPLPTPANVKRQLFGPNGIATKIRDEMRKVATKQARATPFGDFSPFDFDFDAMALVLENQRASFLLADNAPFSAEDPAGAGALTQDWMHAASRASDGEAFGKNTALLTSLSKAATTNPAGEFAPPGAALLATVDQAPLVLDLTAPADAERYRQILGVRDPRTYSGVYRKVPVVRGETPESMAARFMGSWTRWVELVSLNGLRAPYFTDDGAPGTVAFGQTLLVPLDAPGIDAASLTRIEQMRRRFDLLTATDVYLGLDIEVDPLSGDLRVFPALPDVQVVAGRAAFGQSLRMRLGMTVGDWYPHPGLGLGIEVGQKLSPMLLAIMEAVAEVSIRNDPRVSKVTDITTRVEGSVVRQQVRLEFHELDETLTVDVRL